MTGSFFYSTIESKKHIIALNEFFPWFERHCKPEEFEVTEIPFSELEKWSFINDNEKLVHDSGQFFKIEGIHVKTTFRGGSEWDQPIINQPEIGILGYITKVIDGVRYFLMQAKMEPGNINTLQISPTLQATKSNFMRVHQGKSPNYLEYFLVGAKRRVLVDQLQSEQGGRFLRKRNRNVVIEVAEDIPVFEDFCWLSLWQLKELLKKDNILNMDTRSVLSTIPLIEDEVVYELKKMDKTSVSCFMEEYEISEVGRDYIYSYISENSLHSIEDILSWFTEQKVKYDDIKVSSKPLRDLNGWQITDKLITSEFDYFHINAVRVKAGTREVTSWTQPLLKDLNIGLLAFVTKKINGTLHFLIQAKVEPGNRDIVEMSPTVSCSNYEKRAVNVDRPFLLDEVLNGNFKVVYDTNQSEEGGRFFKLQNRNMILRTSEESITQIPSNYIWMTLAQMKEFMRFGMFNIEARSLISSIDFK
ncbi:MAG: NDP-hexose 2,3-dehydratase family protein [Mangrovibacterium sp.]